MGGGPACGRHTSSARRVTRGCARSAASEACRLAGKGCGGRDRWCACAGRKIQFVPTCQRSASLPVRTCESRATCGRRGAVWLNSTHLRRVRAAAACVPKCRRACVHAVRCAARRDERGADARVSAPCFSSPLHPPHTHRPHPAHPPRLPRRLQRRRKWSSGLLRLLSRRLRLARQQRARRAAAAELAAARERRHARGTRERGATCLGRLTTGPDNASRRPGERCALKAAPRLCLRR